MKSWLGTGPRGPRDIPVPAPPQGTTWKGACPPNVPRRGQVKALQPPSGTGSSPRPPAPDAQSTASPRGRWEQTGRPATQGSAGRLSWAGGPCGAVPSTPAPWWAAMGRRRCQRSRLEAWASCPAEHGVRLPAGCGGVVCRLSWGRGEPLGPGPLARLSRLALLWLSLTSGAPALAFILVQPRTAGPQLRGGRLQHCPPAHLPPLCNCCFPSGPLPLCPEHLPSAPPADIWSWGSQPEGGGLRTLTSRESLPLPAPRPTAASLSSHGLQYQLGLRPATESTGPSLSHCSRLSHTNPVWGLAAPGSQVPPALSSYSLELTRASWPHKGCWSSAVNSVSWEHKGHPRSLTGQDLKK